MTCRSNKKAAIRPPVRVLCRHPSHQTLHQWHRLDACKDFPEDAYCSTGSKPANECEASLHGLRHRPSPAVGPKSPFRADVVSVASLLRSESWQHAVRFEEREGNQGGQSSVKVRAGLSSHRLNEDELHLLNFGKAVRSALAEIAAESVPTLTLRGIRAIRGMWPCRLEPTLF